MAVVDILSRVKSFAPERPEYLLGKGLLEPFNNHNAASRKKMFNVHTDHRTQLMEPEIAYVDTAYSNEYGRHNSALLISDMNYQIVGKVSKFSSVPNHDYIVLLHEPVGNSYHVQVRKQYNHITETNGYLYDNSYIDSKQVGDEVKQGDVTRKTTSYDEFNNKRDGSNFQTAFMNIAKTCEDGLLLSEAIRHKFDSPVFKPVQININNNVIPLNMYGGINQYKVCPNIGEDVDNGIIMALRLDKKEESYYMRDYNRLRQPMISDKKFTTGDGKVVDINIYCNDPALLASRAEYAQLNEMYQEQMRYSREIVDMLEPIINDPRCKKSHDLEWHYLYHKRVLEGQPFSKNADKVFSFLVVEFMVLDISRIQVGDKITNRYGGKGVVSGFLPEELMPLLDNGKRVEIIANSAGVVGRLNPGQLLELSSTFVGSRVLELIRSGMLPPEQEYELYLKYMEFFCPNQAKFIKSRLQEMTVQERAEYMEQVCEHDAIHFTPEPISESFGIDLLDKVYKEFDWIKPYTVMVAQRDSTGNYRTLPTRRTLVSGQVYFYRLKQHAEEKFSTTSLSATNIKNQNTRSRSSKLFEAPYSRTPKLMMRALTQECVG